MVNFGLLAAEIRLTVWDTPANFNGFRVLAALLHGSQVVSVSQTLRRWTEGDTYVRQGDHHILVAFFNGLSTSILSADTVRADTKIILSAIATVYSKLTISR